MYIHIIKFPLTAELLTSLAIMLYYPAIIYYNRADLLTCIKSLNTMSRITDALRKREREIEGEREREPL